MATTGVDTTISTVEDIKESGCDLTRSGSEEILPGGDGDDNSVIFPDADDFVGDKGLSWSTIPHKVWFRIKSYKFINTTLCRQMILKLVKSDFPVTELFATPLIEEQVRVRIATKEPDQALFLLVRGLKPSSTSVHSYVDVALKAV